MGNSSITLQKIVDSVRTIGDLTPLFDNAGGYASEPACTIATDTMAELLSQKFNFKFNRVKIAPFVLTSNQADYPTVSLRTLGWIESAAVVDINNTSTPKPAWPVEVERDLPFSTATGGRPAKVSWLLNNQLELGSWPGAGRVYTNPIGAPTSPANPPTAITDAAGNILSLTTYGITGPTAPAAASPVVIGSTVQDGSCVWTVCDPFATGFRVSGVPPQAGNAWLMRLFAQSKPPIFTSLPQTLDPLPDDNQQWFRRGFIAHAHEHSPDPAARSKFEQKQAEWMAAMVEAFKQANREPENYGFFPSTTIMGAGPGRGPTVGNPLGWRGGGW